MNVQMAYLVGLILGNGEIQQDTRDTIVTIEIPHKNLYTKDRKEIKIYVMASTVEIRSMIEPLIGSGLIVTQNDKSTKMSFTKANTDYVIREIIRLVENGTHHSSMRIHPDLFTISKDEKKSLLRGIADSTGYIRRSNCAYGIKTKQHRVYIEIPGNFYLVIDIANMLRDIDIPVQTIDFGHPNFRDGNLSKYNEGKHNFWKKEHQLKIFANEFLPVGFIVKHKQASLEKYSEELLTLNNPKKTHKFYWEKKLKVKTKPIHPAEKDPSLPFELRGHHFDHWTELAKFLGYGPKC